MSRQLPRFIAIDYEIKDTVLGYRVTYFEQYKAWGKIHMCVKNVKSRLDLTYTKQAAICDCFSLTCHFLRYKLSIWCISKILIFVTVISGWLAKNEQET